MLVHRALAADGLETHWTKVSAALVLTSQHMQPKTIHIYRQYIRPCIYNQIFFECVYMYLRMKERVISKDEINLMYNINLKGGSLSLFHDILCTHMDLARPIMIAAYHANVPLISCNYFIWYNFNLIEYLNVKGPWEYICSQLSYCVLLGRLFPCRL